MATGVFEILKVASAASSKVERIQTLRRHNSIPLRRMLRYAFDPRIKWILPEGEYHYKPLPVHQQIGSEQMWYKEARTCYLFMEGDDEYNPNVRPEKRRQKFIELLEALHPEDAEILFTAFRNRRIPYPNIDAGLVAEAFPGLLGNG